jgi:hypothetical protein
MLNSLVRMRNAGTLGVVVLCACLTGCGSGSGTRASSGVLPSLATVPRNADAAVRALSPDAYITQSATTAASTAYAAVVLGDRPLSYYVLNDVTSQLVDSGPYRIGGIYGANVTHGAAPITANAVGAASFPGGAAYNPNGFASTRSSTLLQPSTVTVEAWMRFSATNAAHDLPIVVYGDSLAGVRYGMFLHGLAGSTSGTLLYNEAGSGQAKELRLYGVTRLSAGVTYHIVAVSNGVQVATYVNGLLDQTVSYPGAIDYSTPLTNGLQIGGAAANAAYGSPSFAGTIAQAAVYGRALTPAQVVNHFLAGQLIPMVKETATAADSFVDSIGINAHFGASGSVDSAQFPRTSSLLAASGIRHIRVEMNVNSPSFLSEMKQLAAAGIRANYIVLPGTTRDQILGYPALVSPSLESFEPPNEADDQVGQAYPTWVPGCISEQKNLYSWVKGSASTARYPVLGPGMAWAVSIPRIGNISSYYDVANIHDYLGNYNPGDPYASSIVNVARQTSGGKPIVVTETGYGTGTTSPLLDNRNDLRYMTRLFFELFKDGVARSYSYLFIEYGGLSKFGQFGLIQNSLVPKPAYFGIKSLIGALQDPGAAFAPAALSFRLSGFTNNVHHLLMQKRNGSFVLAIWIEAPGWDTGSATGGDIIVPGQSVTFATATRFSRVSRQSMTASGDLWTSVVPWSGNQATFTVTDNVSLITLSP